MFRGVIDAQTTETYTFKEFDKSDKVTLHGTNCTILLEKNTGSTQPTWSSNQARLYVKGSITISSEKNISKIVYKYTPNKGGKDKVVPTISSVTPNGFDEATKTWTSTGGSNSVKMTLGGTAGNFGFTSLEITYIDEAEPTEPTLTFGDYNNKTIEKHVGDDNFTITASLKPSVEGATITYSSSNESVAIVDENTGEVVVGDEGTSIITAKYVDANSKEQTASYTLNVTKVPTTLSFGAEYDGKTIVKKIGDDIFNVTAVLTPNIDGATITYKSSNDNVATVDDNGDVLIGETIGTAKITASYAGNDTYVAASASYTVSVIDPNYNQNVFDFSGTNDYGSGVEKTSTSSDYVTENRTWVNGDVTMVTSGKYRWWKNTNALRFYGGSFTLTVPEGYHITNVVLTGTNSFDANLDGYENGKWIGNANSVKFTSTDNGKDLKSITVTYVPDATLTTAASSL